MSDPIGQMVSFVASIAVVASVVWVENVMRRLRLKAHGRTASLPPSYTTSRDVTGRLTSSSFRTEFCPGE
jgi:hypothetical protein